MIRHAAVLAVVVCLSPSLLYAQGTQFTVTSSIANVHNGPSTGAAVIGQAPIGAVFTVTRELGSWVRISWPAAEDGVGYLHVTWGRISNGSMPASNQTAKPAPTPIASRSGPAESPSPADTGVQGNRVGAAQGPQAVLAAAPASTPIAHLVGLGGRMGPTLRFSASVRAPVRGRFGVQFEVSRYSPTSAVVQERRTSVQVAPSLLYSLPDKLTDYVWVRPYVGAGLTIHRSTRGSETPGGASVTRSGLGRQVFGGVAVAFASAPRFTLSVDYGRHWSQGSQGSQAPLSDVELEGRGLSVAGHWYVK